MKNIKIILSVKIVIIFQIQVSSQSLNIEWQGCYGGTDTEYPEDILALADGYLVAGATKSNNGDIYFNHGATDGWLFKIGNESSIIWEKTYGGSLGDGIFRIFPADENNFYLLCSANSSDGDISFDPYPETADYWILKVNSNGEIIWDKILGGNGDEQMWTGTVTSDGGIIAFGWTTSNDGDVSIYYGGYDMWLVKLNGDGEKECDFSIGTDGFDFGQAIIQTSDGGFLVGGSSAIGNGGNLICTPQSWAAEAILVKLDASLNIEWKQCYGGSDHDGVTALAEISDGYIFGAYVNSNDGEISGWHGDNDIWIVRTDLWGNIIWQNCFGGSLSEFTSKIIVTDDDDILISGSTQSTDGDVTGNHTISEYKYDIWMVKLNSAGELLWEKCFGGIWDEQVNFGFIKKTDSNFVIAGQTDYGPSFDVNCTPHGGLYDKDLWVFEIKDTLTSVQTNVAFELNLKVCPNPASSDITLAFQNTEHHTNMQLECYNIYGQQVHTEKIWKGQQETKIDLRGWAKGLYFAVVKSEGTLAGSVRFIRQ